MRTQKESGSQNSNKNEQKVQKKKQNAVVIRKIPETLIQSYDFIMLKDEKKGRWRNPMTMKENELAYKQLQKLPILQGKCEFQYYNDSEIIQNQYEISGDLLIFKDLAGVNIKEINKIKLIGSHGENKKKKIKLNIDIQNEEAVVLIHIQNNFELYQVFASIIVRKFTIRQFLINDLTTKKYSSFNLAPNKYECEILKMSGYMGFMNKWEKRKMILTDELKSFKDEKCTFTLKSSKQIWTRFEMQQGYFVIKLYHGLEKIQLGIPLVDFTNVEGARNWLLPLTKLIEQ